MNKNEFMESLKAKLLGLNQEDREDAINYYWEYFEEAGFGEESDVTKNVGNPDDVAAKIIEAAEYVKETQAVDKGTAEETKNEEDSLNTYPRDESDMTVEEDIVKEDSRDNFIMKEDSVPEAYDRDTTNDSCRNELCENTAVGFYKDITPDAFDSIDIDVSSLDVIIRTGDDFGIYVKCKENEPAIEKKNNTLVIKDSHRHKAFSFNFNFNIFNKGKEFVEITIPREKKLIEVRGENDMGKISIFALSMDRLRLEANMGALEIVGVTASDAEIDADMGHVSVKDSEFRRMKIDNDTGAVNADALNVEFAEISTGTGYISLENAGSREVRLDSDTGYIKLKNARVERVIAETDTGLIKFDRVDADYIDASSDTGSVSAKLVGNKDDYSIDLTNDLGAIVVDGRNNGRGICNNSYREGVGNRRLRANVDTGKINIEFLGR